MPDLHIHRDHHLGLPRAREIAFAWAERAEREFDMSCTYAEGRTEDEVRFTRSGVSGTLRVTASRFELDAKLGFLLGAFKGKIEAEIVRNLDQLLAAEAAAAPASPVGKGAKGLRAASAPAAAGPGKASGGPAAKASAKTLDNAAGQAAAKAASKAAGKAPARKKAG